MKKLIGLSAAVLISAMVFAQDTIPKPSNLPKPTMSDTMPTGNKMNMDTSLTRTNKWPDSSKNKNWPDTMNGNNKWPDTTLGNASNDPNRHWNDSSMNSSNKMHDTISVHSSDALNKTNTNRNLDSAHNNNAVKENMQGARDTMSSDTKRVHSHSESDSGSVNKKIMVDRVIMIDNQVMVIKNGDSTLLEDRIKLKSGAIVMKDGSVQYKNGTTTQLKNGQYINLNNAEIKTKKTSSSSKRKKAYG